MEAALRGEQVVLMRGSRHVAAIVPVSADDLELSTSLTDRQAEAFWRRIREERKDGSSLVFQTPEPAVGYLSEAAPRPRRRARQLQIR